MKKIIILCLTELLLAIGVKAQSNFNKTWILGAQYTFKVSFDSIKPRVQIIDSFSQNYFALGASGICDSEGHAILLSSGCNILDSHRVAIQGGDTIGGRAYASHYNNFSIDPQNSLILPFEHGIYYVVYSTVSDSVFNNVWLGPIGGDAVMEELMYSKVDMKQSSVNGKGVVIQKDVKLLEHENLSKVQMMACKHGNGIDWWLFKQARGTNKIFKFLFTRDSVYNYGVQTFPEPVFGTFDLAGQMAFSLDGTKLASTLTDQNLNVFIADFDRCAGVLSNPMVKKVPVLPGHNPWDPSEMDTDCSGVAFSPSNRYLYVTKSTNLVQLDLMDADTNTQWSTISGLDTTWDNFSGFVGLFYGPDTNLYIGTWGAQSYFFSAIENPEAKGANCNFCRACLRFPKNNGSSPPNMPNYDLGSNGLCNPLSTVNVTKHTLTMEVYPNPSNDVIYIKHADDFEKKLYNNLGQHILTTTRNIIDIKSLPKGLYMLHCEGQTIKIILE